MGTQTTAGIKIYIGAAPATYDATGYAAVKAAAGTKLIGEVTDFGEMGKVFNIASYTPFASRGVVEKKVSYNRSHPTIQVALDDADDGQIAVKAALETDDEYSLIVERQDGALKCITAQITGFPTPFSTDSFEMGTISTLAQTDVVDIAAP